MRGFLLLRRSSAWAAGVGLMVGLSLVWVACGSSRQSERQPPMIGATVAPTPDGGLEPPHVSPPLKRKGVIVPGDSATTGIGDSATPGSSTGTNGRAVGPTVGSPGN